MSISYIMTFLRIDHFGSWDLHVLLEFVKNVEKGMGDSGMQVFYRSSEITEYGHFNAKRFYFCNFLTPKYTPTMSDPLLKFHIRSEKKKTNRNIKE